MHYKIYNLIQTRMKIYAIQIFKCSSIYKNNSYEIVSRFKNYHYIFMLNCLYLSLI